MEIHMQKNEIRSVSIILHKIQIQVDQSIKPEAQNSETLSRKKQTIPLPKNRGQQWTSGTS